VAAPSSGKRHSANGASGPGFAPAIKGGEAVSTTMVYKYTFLLD